MTTLVFGATGFVAANVVRHLAAAGEHVVMADVHAPDAALEAFLGDAGASTEFLRLDVRDGAATREAVGRVKPGRAVLAAAITPTPPDVERARFRDAVEINIAGTIRTLEALRDAGVGRVVLTSSGSVYGRRNDMAPLAEDDAPGPLLAVYPMSKAFSEMLALRFAEINGMDLVVARLCSPFGPMERDTGSRPLLSLVSHLARAAIRGETLKLPPPRDTPHDVAHVADVASAVGALLLADRLGHAVYNVGWGRAHTAEQIVAALDGILGGLRHEWLETDPDATPGAQPRGPLISARLEADTGWRPRFNLETGIEAYVDWLKETT
jgi:nucleoside-diphosphate-sugar epimerase